MAEGEKATMLPDGLLQNVQEDVLRRNVAYVKKNLSQNRYKNNTAAKLIAVTKTVSAEVIECLKPLEILDIGENRTQTCLPKLQKISQEFQLHWIGRLQTNKVKDIIEHVSLLHSMDRMSLAQEVNRRMASVERVLPVLLQVNITCEPQKTGLNITEVRPFLQKIKSFSNLQVQGLMAMMPLGAEEEQLTHWFRGMRILFEELREEAMDGVQMEELSMGMSNDYMIAAREGATMVRVGTALYRA